jgi:hypothetical protein
MPVPLEYELEPLRFADKKTVPLKEVRDDGDTHGVDSDDAHIPDDQEGDLTHHDEDKDKESYDDGEIVGPDGERG